MNEQMVYSTDDRLKPLADNVTLTAAWQTLGPPINTKGLLNVAMWINGLKNDSDSIRIRCKCLPVVDSAEFYVAQIQTIGTNLVSLRSEEYETSEPVFSFVTPLGFSAMVPYIQLEAKVNVVGVTPAVINKAILSFDRK